MREKKLYTISIVLCLMDQIVKLIITNYLEVYQKISILPNFFSIYYLQNKGAAFSSFSGMTYLFIGVGFLFLFLLLRYIRKLSNIKKIEIIKRRFYSDLLFLFIYSLYILIAAPPPFSPS